MQFIYICESSELPGQMRVLNGQIYGLHHKILHIEELVGDSNSVGCCLNSFVSSLVLGAIYILIEELEFFCPGAEYGCFEDECFILRESVP